MSAAVPQIRLTTVNPGNVFCYWNVFCYCSALHALNWGEKTIFCTDETSFSDVGTVSATTAPLSPPGSSDMTQAERGRWCLVLTFRLSAVIQQQQQRENKYAPYLSDCVSNDSSHPFYMSMPQLFFFINLLYKNDFKKIKMLKKKHNHTRRSFLYLTWLSICEKISQKTDIVLSVAWQPENNSCTGDVLFAHGRNVAPWYLVRITSCGSHLQGGC